MKHLASPEFWACYRALPKDVRNLADDKFKLLKAEPRHASLHLKKVRRSGAFGRAALASTIEL